MGLLEAMVDVEQSVGDDLGHGAGVANLEVTNEIGCPIVVLGATLPSGSVGVLGGSGDLGVLHIVVHMVGAIAGDDAMTVLSAEVKVLVGQRRAGLIVVHGITRANFVKA